MILPPNDFNQLAIDIYSLLRTHFNHHPFEDSYWIFMLVKAILLEVMRFFYAQKSLKPI